MRDASELSALARRMEDSSRETVSFVSEPIPGVEDPERVWPELADPAFRLAVSALLSVPPVVLGISHGMMYQTEVHVAVCRRLRKR